MCKKYELFFENLKDVKERTEQSKQIVYIEVIHLLNFKESNLEDVANKL